MEGTVLSSASQKSRIPPLRELKPSESFPSLERETIQTSRDGQTLAQATASPGGWPTNVMYWPGRHSGAGVCFQGGKPARWQIVTEMPV